MWSRIYAIATWILIALFTFMAIAHLVLTVLFYLGVWDTGFGYFLDYEWPAWSITIIDGSVAFLFWFAYRRGAESPSLGLLVTVIASVLALARAAWMVFVPLSALATIAGSIYRIAASRRETQSRT